MTAALAIICGMAGAILLGGIVLREKKSQSGFTSYIVFNLVIGMTVLGAPKLTGCADIWAVGVLWIGFVMSWFAVRSHVESSILLRMALMVRDGVQTADVLVACYRRVYGHEARVGELAETGLVSLEGGETSATRKGRVVLAVRSWLLRIWQ